MPQKENLFFIPLEYELKNDPPDRFFICLAAYKRQQNHPLLPILHL